MTLREMASSALALAKAEAGQTVKGMDRAGCPEATTRRILKAQNVSLDTLEGAFETCDFEVVSLTVRDLYSGRLYTISHDVVLGAGEDPAVDLNGVPAGHIEETAKA